MSAVLRWPHKTCGCRPASTCSVYYNDSQKFTPAGKRVTAFNEPHRSAARHHVGIRLQPVVLRRSRLPLRLNRVRDQGHGPEHRREHALIKRRQSTLPSLDAGSECHAPGRRPAFRGGIAGRRRDRFNALCRPTGAYLYDVRTAAWRRNIQSTFRAGGISRQQRHDGLHGEGDQRSNSRSIRHGRGVFWRNVSSKTPSSPRSLPHTVAFIPPPEARARCVSGRPYGNFPLTNNDGTPYVFGTPLADGRHDLGQWLETNVYVPLATTPRHARLVDAELPKYRA